MATGQEEAAMVDDFVDWEFYRAVVHLGADDPDRRWAFDHVEPAQEGDVTVVFRRMKNAPTL